MLDQRSKVEGEEEGACCINRGSRSAKQFPLAKSAAAASAKVIDEEDTLPAFIQWCPSKSNFRYQKVNSKGLQNVF